MAIDTVGATGAAMEGGARSRLAENFDTFLSLLTAQLKNQDPLSPMDSTQFTQQIVQMTGVEQQLLTNDLLKKLVSNAGSGVATAVSLIGKEVRADDDQAVLKADKAEWTYALARDASDVKLEVLDEKGRVIRSIAPTDNKAGEHEFVWDGKSNEGTKMPEGVYTLRVTAKDSQAAVVASNVYADGVVTGVEQKDGATLITVNGALVPWDRIVSIRQPPPPATAPNGESSATGSTPNATDDKTSSPAAA